MIHFFFFTSRGLLAKLAFQKSKEQYTQLAEIDFDMGDILCFSQVRGTRPVRLYQYVQEYGLSGSGHPGALALCQFWTE